MRRHVYFTEDQRWPSKSQRFGWLVVMGIALFIAFQLNLHLVAPLYAVPVLLLLLLLLLSVLTLQQRLTLRIGSELLDADDTPVVRRFWRRAARAAPLVAADDDEPAQVIRITYVFKGPAASLAPGRRGARLGRDRQRIPLTDVQSWSASRLPLSALFRRGGSAFPVGMQREAVTLILEDGRRLMIPTRLQPALLDALSAAKVDSIRQEQAVHQVTREEL